MTSPLAKCGDFAFTMRKLFHIFLFVILLCGIVSGCRGWSSDRRLVAADTLIAHGAFDSALTQLRTIDTTALSTDDRAYHALLMVHAAYKAYADSICLDTTWIARARSAYADGGPYDRHIRTLLYSGCIAEDLGDPFTAMRWFKLADKDADKDDHSRRGYTFLNIATLYHEQFNADSVAIKYYKKAIEQYNHVPEEELNLLYCLSGIARFYTISGRDSADYYLKLALDKSKAAGNWPYYYENLVTTSGKAYYQHDYAQSLKYARQVMEEAPEMASYRCRLFACASYAKLGKVDSALMILEQSPAPATFSDSVIFWQTKSDIAAAQGDVKSHIAYNDSAEDIDDRVLLASQHAKLLEVDQSFDNDKLKNSISDLLKRYAAIWIVLLVIALVLVYTMFRLFKTKAISKQDRKELEKMYEILQAKSAQLEQLKSDVASDSTDTNTNIQEDSSGNLSRNDIFIDKTVTELASTYRMIINRCTNTTDLNQLKNILKDVFTPAFFSRLRLFVDSTYHGMASSMANAESLTQQEVNILCMHICKMPNAFIAVYADLTSVHSVTKLKNTIAARFLGSNKRIMDLDQLLKN